jgi:hypothetical protein
MVPKYIHHLALDNIYTVFRVERVRRCRTKLCLLWVWESERVWGKYFLPIPDFFCENEVIQINRGYMYLEIMHQGVDPKGDPVLIVNKKQSRQELTIFNKIIGKISVLNM